MGIIDILYFHVYNAYYQDGNYSNDIPHLTAYGIVGCSLSFALASILLTIAGLASNNLPSWIFFVFIILGLLLSYFLFLHKKRYQMIYERIKNSKYDHLFFKILSWFIIICGFAQFVLYVFFFNRIK